MSCKLSLEAKNCLLEHRFSLICKNGEDYTAFARDLIISRSFMSCLNLFNTHCLTFRIGGTKDEHKDHVVLGFTKPPLFDQIFFDICEETSTSRAYASLDQLINIVRCFRPKCIYIRYMYHDFGNEQMEALVNALLESKCKIMFSTIGIPKEMCIEFVRMLSSALVDLECDWRLMIDKTFQPSNKLRTFRAIYSRRMDDLMKLLAQNPKKLSLHISDQYKEDNFSGSIVDSTLAQTYCTSLTHFHISCYRENLRNPLIIAETIKEHCPNLGNFSLTTTIHDTVGQRFNYKVLRQQISHHYNQIQELKKRLQGKFSELFFHFTVSVLFDEEVKFDPQWASQMKTDGQFGKASIWSGLQKNDRPFLNIGMKETSFSCKLLVLPCKK